jgi:hypothetical protein
MNERIVGKNALESLTTGMYKDCRIIFREYIQNSADAIDLAIQQDLIKKEQNRIEVIINGNKREIIIRDNGIGIQSSLVYNTLGDIGVTTKDYTKNRGFRGIGRLGGLGYCDELQFITSHKGEPIKTITTWNCKELKYALRPDINPHSSVFDVVNNVTHESHSEEASDAHYFEVILKGVNNEKLLDFDDIKDYLAQSAPVPFNYQNFSALKCINESLIERGKPPEEYNVFINKEQVFKPYRRKVTAGVGKDSDKEFIEDLKFFDSYKGDGSLFFLGWYGITKMSGYIRDKDLNGIRVRKHNILIGDNYTLDTFFGDNQTYQIRNRWYVGEIYVYDDNLIPNARRDDFEENETYFEFKKEVEKVTRDLGKFPSEVSKERNISKKVDLAEESLTDIKNEISKGLTKTSKEKLFDKIDSIEKEIKNVHIKQKEKPDKDLKTNLTITISKNEISEKKNNILKQIEKLKEKVTESDNFIIDRIPSSYPKEVRKVVRTIFEIIDRELPQKDARQLQEKIINEL